MKNAFNKKHVLYGLVILMICEIGGIVLLSKINDDSYTVALKMKNVSEEQQESLIENTVKKQQELTSNQIKQSLLNYVNENNIDLVNKDKEWNREEVEKVLNITVEPIKVFGNKGGVIVFDSITGDVFLDTTPEKTLGNNIKESRLKKEQVDMLMVKKDTASDDGLILANLDEVDDPHNFDKYPLGKHDRSFIERSILPFETLGFAKEKQLTILISANETDIFKRYVADYEEIEQDIIMIEKGAKASVIVTGMLSAITIIAAVGILYTYKNKKA